jgi:hypothetical protein
MTMLIPIRVRFQFASLKIEDGARIWNPSIAIAGVKVDSHPGQREAIRWVQTLRNIIIKSR